MHLLANGLGPGGSGVTFVATGILGEYRKLTISLNLEFTATGPAARTDGYVVSTLDGDPVSVLGVTINGGAAKTIVLDTSAHTYNANYSLSLPETGIISTSLAAFQGPFLFNYLGGQDTPVAIQLVRAVDARIVEIIFNRAVNQSDAETPTNYHIDPPLAVYSARRVTAYNYLLTTEQQTIGASYDVTISGIRGA